MVANIRNEIKAFTPTPKPAITMLPASASERVVIPVTFEDDTFAYVSGQLVICRLRLMEARATAGILRRVIRWLWVSGRG